MGSERRCTALGTLFGSLNCPDEDGPWNYAVMRGILIVMWTKMFTWTWGVRGRDVHESSAWGREGQYSFPGTCSTRDALTSANCTKLYAFILSSNPAFSLRLRPGLRYHTHRLNGGNFAASKMTAWDEGVERPRGTISRFFGATQGVIINSMSYAQSDKILTKARWAKANTPSPCHQCFWPQPYLPYVH